MKQELASVMLHGIVGNCDFPREQSAEEKFYDISKNAFTELLNTISIRRLSTITSSEIDSHETARHVLITFDDGRLSDFAIALPALLERNMHGVFFVVTDWIGRQGYMSEAQLREMLTYKMDIQVHGKTHRFLSDLSDNALRAELQDAKARLQDILGKEVNSLAYPGGRGGVRVQAIAQELGYQHLFCSKPGWYRPGMREIPRMVVHGNTTLNEIGKYLDGKRGPVWRQEFRHIGGRALRHALGPKIFASIKNTVRGH